MRMKTIAFAQQKGGVGKSSLAIHLAVDLIQQGHRVAILDLDPQGSVLKWAARRECEAPIVSSSDFGAVVADVRNLESKGFDYTILDLPGSRAPGVSQGIKLADLVLIPARPLDMDIEASGETLATAQRLARPHSFVMSMVPARGSRGHEFAELLEAHGHRVITPQIKDHLSYPDAIAEGLGISEFAPNSKAATEFAAFTTAVLELIK